jgi:hypothetical protein
MTFLVGQQTAEFITGMTSTTKIIAGSI